MLNCEIDMVTTIVVGNSATKVVNGKMVTARGYDLNSVNYVFSSFCCSNLIISFLASPMVNGNSCAYGQVIFCLLAPQRDVLFWANAGLLGG